MIPTAYVCLALWVGLLSILFKWNGSSPKRHTQSCDVYFLLWLSRTLNTASNLYVCFSLSGLWFLQIRLILIPQEPYPMTNVCHFLWVAFYRFFLGTKYIIAPTIEHSIRPALPPCPCSRCAKKCAARYHCRVMMWFSYYAKITIWSGHTSAGIRLTSKEYEPQTCLFFYRGQTSLLYIWSASQNTEGGWPCLFCFKRSRPVQRHCFKNKESEAPCLLFPLEPSSSKQMSGLGIRNQGTSSKCVQLCALLRAISLSI